MALLPGNLTVPIIGPFSMASSSQTQMTLSDSTHQISLKRCAGKCLTTGSLKKLRVYMFACVCKSS